MRTTPPAGGAARDPAGNSRRDRLRRRDADDHGFEMAGGDEARNPTALCLTRQALPCWMRSALPVSDAARGGYVLEGDDDPDVILIATDFEVRTVQEARVLSREVTSQVVSLPSWELFDGSHRPIADQVCPPSRLASASRPRTSLGCDEFARPGRDNHDRPARRLCAQQDGARPPRLHAAARRRRGRARTLSDPRRGHHAMTRLHRLPAAGADPWLRQRAPVWLDWARFRQWVDDGVVGVTSNPDHLPEGDLRRLRRLRRGDRGHRGAGRGHRGRAVRAGHR